MYTPDTTYRTLIVFDFEYFIVAIFNEVIKTKKFRCKVYNIARPAALRSAVLLCQHCTFKSHVYFSFLFFFPPGGRDLLVTRHRNNMRVASSLKRYKNADDIIYGRVRVTLENVQFNNIYHRRRV